MFTTSPWQRLAQTRYFNVDTLQTPARHVSARHVANAPIGATMLGMRRNAPIALCLLATFAACQQAAVEADDDPERFSKFIDRLVLFVATKIPATAAISQEPVPTYAPPASTAPDAGQLGGPREDLTGDEKRLFLQGRVAFLISFDTTMGLGPHYVGVACGACHDRPILGGGSDVAHGVTYMTTLTEPHTMIAVPARTSPGYAKFEVPSGARAGRRVSGPLFGLGLLEQVPLELVEAGCDSEDEDGDGVRGHARVLPGGRLGRFGHKADASTLEDMVAHQLHDAIGITSPVLPEERREDFDTREDPEVTEGFVKALAAYVRGLAPPLRASNNPRGESLFRAIGCAACHRPNTSDRVRGTYTDLCLHKMGPGLDDGVGADNLASEEWRTPPLWGMRFRAAFLHDHRARTPEDAISHHGGEAQTARDAFFALPEADRAALRDFLSTL